MAKRDSTENMINEGLALGRANQVLIPEIKKWCAHVELKDISGGLMAMSGLPTNVSIRCQHTTGGSSGMQLEWIAGAFISENCIGCPHQMESDPENFGRKMLAEKASLEKTENDLRLAEEAVLQQLKKRIQSILPEQKAKSGITELSILSLLDRLNSENSDERKKASEEVTVAANMHPEFFTPLSLDILLLYFQDVEIGSACIQAVGSVTNFLKRVPDSIVEKTINSINKGVHIEDCAVLLSQYLTKENADTQIEVLKKLIGNLTYARFLRSMDNEVYSYPNSVKLILQLIEWNESSIRDLLSEFLASNEKITRINLLGLLSEILPHHPQFVSSLLGAIISSLELEDDSFLDSADHAVCKLLAQLTSVLKIPVWEEIKLRRQTLSLSARVSLVAMYRQLFKIDELTSTENDFTGTLVRELVESSMRKSNDSEEHEAFIAALEDVSGDHPELFSSYFDTLLGYLVQLVDDQKTFKHYQNEIANKSLNEVSTFNPLIGKQWFELNSDAMKLQNAIMNVKDTIKHIYKIDPNKHQEKIRELVIKLDSSSQEDLKLQVLNLISNSVNNPSQAARIIPDLYSWLLDPASLNIRHEALKLLQKIIERYPQVVTLTLLDLVDVFLADPTPVIKGMAFDILGTIAKTWPERITTTHIEKIDAAITDRYVYVGQQAAGICGIILPFTDYKQKMGLLAGLGTVEDYYFKNKKWAEATSIVDQMLIVTKDFPTIFPKIVQHYLLKYCRCEEDHIAAEATRDLRRIKKDYPEFESEWLKITMEQLEKTHFHFSDDEREETFAKIYETPGKVITENLSLFTSFLNSRNENDGFDIAHTIAILSYFGEYNAVSQFTAEVLTKFSDVAANQYIRKFAGFHGEMSKYELSLSTGKPNQESLKIVKDACTKD